MIQTLKYKPHKISALFPPMTTDEKHALTADIKANGLVEPIVLFEDAVLDGVHRQEACVKAGIKPRYVQFDKSGDPLGFVVAKNLRRRHLTTGQRAMIATELANMTQGERTDLEPSANSQKVSQSEAAKTMGVSSGSVSRAAKLKKEQPAKAAAVKAGKTSLAKATGASSKAADKKAKLETAYARIAKVCDKGLADAVHDKRRLKNPKDVIAFASLDDGDMKKVAGLLEEGWPLKKARLFKAKNLTRRHLIEDMMNKAASNHGELTVTIDSWKFDVTRVKSALKG